MPAADVAETAARAGEAAERAQRGHVVRAIRIREVDVLVRIVDIPADLELASAPAASRSSTATSAPRPVPGEVSVLRPRVPGVNGAG